LARGSLNGALPVGAAHSTGGGNQRRARGYRGPHAHV